MPKLQFNSKSGQYSLNIPKDLVIFKKWKKGKEFKIIENESGEIVLEPVKKRGV